MKKYLVLLFLISLQAFASQGSKEIIIVRSDNSSLREGEQRLSARFSSGSKSQGSSSSEQLEQNPIPPKSSPRPLISSTKSLNPFGSVNNFQTPHSHIFASKRNNGSVESSGPVNPVFRPTATLFPPLNPSIISSSPYNQGISESFNPGVSVPSGLNRGMINSSNHQDLTEIKEKIELVNVRLDIVSREQSNLIQLITNQHNETARDMGTITSELNVIHSKIHEETNRGISNFLNTRNYLHLQSNTYHHHLRQLTAQIENLNNSIQQINNVPQQINNVSSLYTVYSPAVCKKTILNKKKKFKLK